MRTFSYALLPLTLGLAISSPAQATPTTFVHLFEWSWKDIATECESFLGPKGYAAVQVSPPSEHIIGAPWWTRYQPVSYLLESRGGNRAEFADMVSRCKAVGVDIYVDAVINHMAAGSGTGVAGSSFGNKQYPNYAPWDFHSSCEIQNYGDRWQVQNCELVGLADLNTGASYVQQTLANYLNDLISLGVTGFRIDAAKHMDAGELGAILAKLDGQPLVFQEVIDQGYEAVSATEYTGNGLVTEFKYSVNIGNVFRTGSLAWLKNFGEAWGMLPSYQAVVFVDNHDNQRGHGGGGNVISFEDGRLYELANVFMLAWPYGYPKVMSSFDFHHDTDAGAPSEPVHGQSLNCFGDGWQCEHRWPYISGAMSFRNHTASDWRVTNWWDNGHNQIAFSRGEQGFVAINHQGSPMQQTLQTGMAPGHYCNVLNGEMSANGKHCSGDTLQVQADGTLAVSLGAEEALAIHVGARLDAAPANPKDWQRTVIFIQAQTQTGQDLFVRGGLDHQMAASYGKDCSASDYACAIPIRHNNLKNATTAPWKAGDDYLDWRGIEPGQGSGAEGSALDWTIDVWPLSWGTRRTVALDGYGEEPLNLWGAHYWMLDVDMDCSQTHNGWFELKAFLKNGQGWESDIAQADTPYPSGNHFGRCGKINQFYFNGSQANIRDF